MKSINKQILIMKQFDFNLESICRKTDAFLMSDFERVIIFR